MARKNQKRADGRLQSKVYLGDGKYKYVYASTQKELNQKIQEVKLKIGKGLDVSAERDTFGSWSQKWLKLKKTEVSNGRYGSYVCRVKNFEPLLSTPITKIRSADVQDIIIDMAEQGYAQKTIKDARNAASQIFKLAIDNRVIDYNPASSVRLPSETPHTDRRALTPEEQQWIVNTPHRAQRAAMIMMYAGLRRGELIPLLWTDIDLKNKTIRVDKSVEMINGKSILKEGTKTESGVRTVYIPQVLADFLAAEPRNNNMLVCPSANGKMITDSGWKRMWDSYLSELNYKYGDFSGILVPDKQDPDKMTQYKKPKSRFAPQKIPFVIPRITAHWLRHTFITLMYLAGVDVLTAKEQAGHADISTTMSIYTHLDSIHKVKQINKLDEYLSNSKASDGCQMGVKVSGK